MLDDLNPEQLEAATADGHVLAIAAPGSGKTKMLSVKAAFLLSKGHSVVAVTFTRDAAMELLERTLKVAGRDALPRLLVGTFHSVNLLMCFPKRAKTAMGREILQKGWSTLTKPWKLVSEGDRRHSVQRAIADARLDGMKLEEATAMVESFKTGHALPKTNEEQLLWDVYAQCLERQETIDFLDILVKTNQAIKDKTVSTLQTDYLLLDEFQDTDKIQFEWMELHARAGVKVTAVGDDDQSIYGFRRALGFEGMRMFADNLNAPTVVLGKNYRSHAEVLGHAGELIAKNSARMDKALVSHKGVGGDVEWERFQTRDLEAEACAVTAQQAVKDGVTFGVLTRTNKRLDAVEAELKRRDVHYLRSADSGSLLDRPEVIVMISAVGCLIHPKDKKLADKVLAWCGVPEADLTTIFDRLWGIASIINTKALANLPFSKETVSTVRGVGKRFDELRGLLEKDALVLHSIADILKDHAPDNFAKDNIDLGRKLFDTDKPIAIRYEQIHAELAAPKGDKKNQSAPVNLMTAHASKGLEFDRVWILGAEEETFPAKSGGIEEERRLMYVAITRARKSLVVSAAGKKEPSRFIFESGFTQAEKGKYVTHPT